MHIIRLCSHIATISPICLRLKNMFLELKYQQTPRYLVKLLSGKIKNSELTFILYEIKCEHQKTFLLFLQNLDPTQSSTFQFSILSKETRHLAYKNGGRCSYGCNYIPLVQYTQLFKRTHFHSTYIQSYIHYIILQSWGWLGYISRVFILELFLVVHKD